LVKLKQKKRKKRKGFNKVAGDENKPLLSTPKGRFSYLTGKGEKE